jgi:hypothetical protein
VTALELELQAEVDKFVSCLLLGAAEARRSARLRARLYHDVHYADDLDGPERARYLTAIGDPVNTASRLETLTKEYGCQLVVSETVTSQAGVDLSAFPVHEIQVRGRMRPLQVRVIPNALALESALLTAEGARRA